MQFFESVNVEKFFPYDADIVFRARCFTYVSVVNIELNFDSDADYVQFPVEASAFTPILLLEPSVYMRFHPLY